MFILFTLYHVFVYSVCECVCVCILFGKGQEALRQEEGQMKSQQSRKNR